MKKVFILLLACIMAVPVYAQEPETVPDIPEVTEAPEVTDVPEAAVATPVAEEPVAAPVVPEVSDVPEVSEEIETPQNTKVTLGANEVLIIEENGDTMRVQLGDRGISIIEGEEGTEIKVLDMEESRSQEESSVRTKRRKRKFRPHYAGLEIGLNNFLTPNFDMNLPGEQAYMDLNTGRSWNWNINFLEYGLGLGTDYIGLVTGLGFEFTNYVFDSQNSITKDLNGDIMEYVPLDAGNMVKSKFNMTYLTAPLLLEVQIPAGRKRIHLSGGLIGGVKLSSSTKIKYEISGEKSKEKAKGDFNLSPLRYGVTVRLGYRAVNFYANYYLTSLFGENEGPELYPFAIGLSLIPF